VKYLKKEMSSTRKKFIGLSFFFYLGAFYGGINLYLNDKLRAEMNQIISKGLKRQELLSIHERNAGSYEKKSENFEFRNQIHKYRRILFSYCNGRVLELGVGTGRSLEFYKNDATDITAIDHSEKMLSQAREKLEPEAREHFRINKDLKIRLLNMDCEDILEKSLFPLQSFDSIIDFNNFHTYSDPVLVYNTIKKLLKPGGHFMFLARGESSNQFIKDFYKMFKPFVFMKWGMDLTNNWAELVETDTDYEILFKERKNYGRTYIYILKLKESYNV
jgi:SAM-dependent methyltransferase